MTPQAAKEENTLQPEAVSQLVKSNSGVPPNAESGQLLVLDEVDRALAAKMTLVNNVYLSSFPMNKASVLTQR